ncbi:MAG: tRNA-dihydrouridine synthase [bacterium]|nr:tRNA-dihydrouridine synthase [bacterium]
MDNFWNKLPKPFFALAPLEDVTDAAFRRVIAKYSKYGGHDIGDGSKENLPAEAFRVGGPDVMFTEFTSADGLFFANESGQEKLRAKLIFSDSERPIVAQLFTSSAERMKKAAEIVAELGFDGVDINMGCPDKAVEKSGCGAALIKNPKLARELICAARASGLPVSVKTRIGYSEDELDTWLPELLAENLSAITIHARTRKEMSEVPARWETIARAVTIRDTAKSSTLIIGNGDVHDMEDARAKAKYFGCDGVMLGKAIFGNPFLFSSSKEFENKKETKLKALSEHISLFEALLSGTSNYVTLKKHFASYVKGWGGAKELRTRLMETKNSAEALSIIASDIMSV